MTEQQKRTAVVLGLALVAWWLWPRLETSTAVTIDTGEGERVDQYSWPWERSSWIG